jgi:hypothetical protein
MQRYGPSCESDMCKVLPSHAENTHLSDGLSVCKHGVDVFQQNKRPARCHAQQMSQSIVGHASLAQIHHTDIVLKLSSKRLHKRTD